MKDWLTPGVRVQQAETVEPAGINKEWWDHGETEEDST